MSQIPASPTEFPSTLPEGFALPADAGEAAEAAAKLLWESGLEKILTRACESSYVEDIDLQMGSRRDGVEISFLDKVATTPWGEAVDDIQERNWDYVAEGRDSAFKDEFESAIHERRGPLGPLWAALGEAATERDEDLDLDDFQESVREAAYELAREEGLDALFDVSARLVGSCEARASLSFTLNRGPDDDGAGPMIPNLASMAAAADWAEALAFLGIHPVDLANACRERALRELADPELCSQRAEKSGLSHTALAREARGELARQGMSRKVGRDPSKWSGGMATLARAWAASCESLPRAGSAPCVSVEAFVDALAQDNGAVEMELVFGVDGSSLQAHSELIDRFESRSPLCCEGRAQQSLSIPSPALEVNGVEIAFAGSAALSVDEARFSEDSTRDGGPIACQEARREAASKAEELSWLLRSPSRATGPADPKRVERLASELGEAEPEAFERAVSKARARDDASGELLAVAESAHEKSAAERDARRAKRGMGPLATSKTATVEDFDLRRGVLASAPWRSQVGPKSALSRDSLGNTLAHKACAGQDAALLADALAWEPSLAEEPNLAGALPIDAIHHARAKSGFAELALAFLGARPDLANAHAASGRTFLDLAAARTMPADDFGRLMDAGCSLGALSASGEAPWSHWGFLAPDKLKPLLEAAIERGWDIDSPDAKGRRLAHIVGRLDSAKLLAELGANLSLRDDEGNVGGGRLRPQEYAQLEESVLKAQSPERAARQKARSI